MEKLKYFTNNQLVTSRTNLYFDAYDPSNGAVVAQVPACTLEEINQVVAHAKAAFPGWAATPVMKRVQILYRVRELLIEHLEELTHLVALENGKVYEEALGDVLKAKEGTEQALMAPTMLQGESLMDASSGYDTVLYREPLGVFVGIVPFNFPAMIPFGWMAPICVASGNTIVLKASNQTPRTALRIAELYAEAGMPAGVVNVVTTANQEAEALLHHPDVTGITFVGSTKVGRHIYQEAASGGKRVQALCQAKNHALVLKDAPIDRVAAGIINSAFGCGGQRCMALPVVVIENEVADQLINAIKTQAMKLKIGPACDKTSQLGPVVSPERKKAILDWIDKGIQEGARLVLDGRQVTVDGHENGFYLGPTIFDRVTETMTVGQEEIFGPVLCVKRVDSFSEGLALMNASPYGNGSIIFTQNGHYAREFVKRTGAGMVGVNVGIPVPIGTFPFNGHKQSFFGDIHVLGRDGFKFYTEAKVVTTRWFDEEEKKKTKVSTWDGTI
ncbi:MAG: CoA-acylating methylmalonate-semialdehyde dehydrogenase [Bacilli bacterium]|jgi:malonate-semialdehyde dehydrogenase (acetylating)/methylmalonate-semialdehyde dehydrogenase